MTLNSRLFSYHSSSCSSPPLPSELHPITGTTITTTSSTASPCCLDSPLSYTSPQQPPVLSPQHHPYIIPSTPLSPQSPILNFSVNTTYHSSASPLLPSPLHPPPTNKDFTHISPDERPYNLRNISSPLLSRSSQHPTNHHISSSSFCQCCHQHLTASTSSTALLPPPPIPSASSPSRSSTFSLRATRSRTCLFSHRWALLPLVLALCLPKGKKSL